MTDEQYWHGFKVGDHVQYKRILNRKLNERWVDGVIHHVRSYDGDCGITIKVLNNQWHLKLIDDAPGYSQGDWRKLGGVNYYKVRKKEEADGTDE